MAVLGACAPATPETPTWLADVRPILTGNCTRCHGHPALGGAPSSFRLDVYQDTEDQDRLIRGAWSMRKFIAARTAGRGDMPPRGPKLSGRQKDILDAWQDVVVTESVGMRADNRQPAVKGTDLGSTGELLKLDVLVTDPDRDPVVGELRTGGGYVIGPLRSGRQTLEWDTGVLAPGSHSLVAAVDDGSGLREIEIGSRTIEPRGNTAPSFELLGPGPDTLLHKRDGVARITFTVTDPDPDDALTLDLDAIHGETIEPIVKGLTVRPGSNTYDWNLAEVAPVTNWRIKATIKDHRATRIFAPTTLLVSDSTTPDSYQTVKSLIDAVCARCHDDVVEVGPDFTKLESLRAYSGRAWRKVGQLREMPPKSMSEVLADPPTFSEADRARLAAWFLAGAP